MIPPTIQRKLCDRGHYPPASGLDHTGRPWRGTSRILNKAARRKKNRRTWRALMHEARVTAAAMKKGTDQ